MGLAVACTAVGLAWSTPQMGRSLILIGLVGSCTLIVVGITLPLRRALKEAARREIEAKSANERLQFVLRSSGYGVWELELGNQRLSWDDRMHDIYGVARGSFGENLEAFQKLLHPSDREAVVRHREDVLAGRIPLYDIDFRIIRSDGALRMIEAHGFLVRDGAGNASSLVGLNRDITSDREMRETLRVAEERLELALVATNESVWDWNIATGQVYRDRRWAEMLDLGSGDSIGRIEDWADRVHPDDLPSARAAMNRHFEGKSPLFVSEHRMRTASGTWIWTLDRGRVVSRTEKGAPLRMVGTQGDITERKLLEGRLRQSEQISIQMARLAQIGAWEQVIGTGEMVWSPEMFRLCEVELGYAPSREGMNSLFPEIERDFFEHALAQATLDGRPFDLECPLVTARGNRRQVRVIGQAEFKEGRAIRIYGTLQDVTARKQAEEAQRKLEGQLFQAQKMETLGTLAGGIAHDFNNLLTGIMGYQDLALDVIPEGDPSRPYIAEARGASLRARDLVEQILTFSRQSGTSERISIDLGSVIEEARRFLRATVPSSIQIHLEIDPGCGRVVADAAQLHQLLLNLGTNAAYAMRSTGGVLTISLDPVPQGAQTPAILQDLQSSAYLRLSVQDTGHGMDSETQKRIFDPFFTTKGVGEGTGLGLAVVHGIVKSHGGAIDVSSVPGRGTRFDVFLPVVESESEEEVASEEPLPRGRGETICVVDDEDFVAQVTRIHLERFGYTPVVFDDPQSCLEAIRRNPQAWSMLLTDQTMPGMTGMKLASLVREVAPRMPVVIMSGYFSKASEEAMEQLGNASLLAKPFTLVDLCTRIERTLRGDAP